MSDLKRLLPRLFAPSESQKKKAETATIKKVQALQNEVMLDLLKKLVDDAKFALNNNEHEKVVQILHDLILHDLNLMKIINGQLMGEITITQATLQNSIELESYYNLTRSKILISIVDSLNTGINIAKDFIKTNFKYSMEYYNYYNEVYKYYIHSLDFLLEDKDDMHQHKMHQECYFQLVVVEDLIKQNFPTENQQY